MRVGMDRLSSGDGSEVAPALVVDEAEPLGEADPEGSSEAGPDGEPDGAAVALGEAAVGAVDPLSRVRANQARSATATIAAAASRAPRRGVLVLSAPRPPVPWVSFVGCSEPDIVRRGYALGMVRGDDRADGTAPGGRCATGHEPCIEDVCDRASCSNKSAGHSVFSGHHNVYIG